MKSKNFPFKIGDKEFEADVTFDGTIAAFEVIDTETLGKGEYECVVVKCIDGQRTRLFPSSFPKGSIVIIARERSSEKLE